MSNPMVEEDALRARALSRVVQAETWRRERVVNYFRCALFSAVGLAEWAERSGQGYPHLTTAPFVFIAWGVTVGVFNVTWLRRHFKAWIPAAITTIDIVVLTVVVRIIYGHAIVYGESSAREIDRAMVGLIAVVAINIVRFSWRTSLWSGVCALASLGYLRVYSGTIAHTAILTDILIFAAIVSLLVYANRSFRTITERLLFDLRRAQEQRLSALRALVAGVTHEVNSPLGAISANVQMSAHAADILSSRADRDDAEARRAVESFGKAGDVSRKAIARISSIIRALGDFARVDESEVERVDLRRNLDTCVELLSTGAIDRIAFVRNYPEPLDVTCRPAQINQALMHILRNAVESIDGTGKVTISGTREADAIHIEVNDTGRGIAKDKLDGIFDLRFGAKGERVGVGLGLPISHSIVHDHGGTIALRSAPGEGTTVTLRLPRAES